MITLLAGLDQMPVPAFFVPSEKRLPAKVNRDTRRATNDLASFHREINFAAAFVTEDRSETRVECFFQ